jgi:hypothetical protein
MKRAEKWLVSILLAVSALGATAPATLAYTGDVWSNSNAFKATCLGFNDTYPAQAYSLARSGFLFLGYGQTGGTLGGALGSSFTRSAFLNDVLYDYAVYAHTHGDNYWASSGYPNVDSALLQDPGSGKCNSYPRDAIRSSSIKAATLGTPYNLVIMSTCMLGSSRSTMPDAFQIKKTKSSLRSEFYLGYVYSTYDSSAVRFESAFWSYLKGSTSHTRTLYQAFTYAQSIGGYAIPNSASPFTPNWWGNPAYNGILEL